MEDLHGRGDAGEFRDNVGKVDEKPVIMTKNVGRNPNSSRIRSDSPLPVTTPMRAHISSVTYNAMVIGISDHSSA